MRRYVSHYGIPAVCLICFSLQSILRSIRSLHMAGNTAVLEVRRGNTAVVGKVTTASTTSTIHNNNNSNTKKLPLYLITPTNRPHLLTRSIFYVMPLRECWDLHWVIIHSLHHDHPNNDTERPTPLFANVFDWITEIFAYDATSQYGNHERNVGIEHVLSRANHHTHHHGGGLVYFLDDDNTLSMDTCRTDVQDVLHAQAQQQAPPMYYANQYWCSGQRKIQTRGYPTLFSKLLRDDNNHHHRHRSNNNNHTATSTNKINPTTTKKRTTLVRATDTGTWLTPVWLLQQVYVRPNNNSSHNVNNNNNDGIHWHLPAYSADGIFFTELVSYVLTTRNHDNDDDDLIRPLPPTVKFHYNRLTSRCTPQPPWTDHRRVQASLRQYSPPPPRTTSTTSNGNESSSSSLNDAQDWYIGWDLLVSSLPRRRRPVVVGVVGGRHDHDAWSWWFTTTHQSDTIVLHNETTLSSSTTTMDILLLRPHDDDDDDGRRSADDIVRYGPLVSPGGYVVFSEFSRAVLWRLLIANGPWDDDDEYEILGGRPPIATMVNHTRSSSSWWRWWDGGSRRDVISPPPPPSHPESSLPEPWAIQDFVLRKRPR